MRFHIHEILQKIFTQGLGTWIRTQGHQTQTRLVEDSDLDSRLGMSGTRTWTRTGQTRLQHCYFVQVVTWVVYDERHPGKDTLGAKKKCLFALPCQPLHFDPHLSFFFLLFFLKFMTKPAVFSHQNLMIDVNLFSLMCIITLTIPQFLHVIYDITVDHAPGRFSSHHCRNHWSTLCSNSKKKKEKTFRPPAHIFKQICVEGKQFFLFAFISLSIVMDPNLAFQVGFVTNDPLNHSYKISQWIKHCIVHVG